jgi:hypothetical protein
MLNPNSKSNILEVCVTYMHALAFKNKNRKAINEANPIIPCIDPLTMKYWDCNYREVGQKISQEYL